MSFRGLYHVIFMYLFTAFSLLMGQDEMMYKDIALPYIHDESIRLDMPEDSSRFVALFGKINRIKHGSSEQLHIIHIGGSHVQAGAMTDRLRRHFSGLLPEELIGDRGFVFPYTIAGYNNPSDYKVDYTGQWKGCRSAYRKHDCHWGLAGLSAITTDPVASITVKPAHHIYGSHLFDRCRLYFQDSEAAYQIEVLNWECPVQVTLDSLHGFIEWQFDNDQRNVEILIRKLDITDTVQTFSVMGLQFLKDSPGITVHGIGVNGAKVSSFLRCDDLSRQLCLIEPDLIIFGIGLNDVYMPNGRFKPESFREDYEALLQRIDECPQKPALIFLTNNDHYYRKRFANKNNYKSNMVFYDLARAHDGAIFDLFNIMGGLQSMKKWRDDDLAKSDLIHFKSKGYHIIADMIFDAFERQYINFALPEKHSK